MTELEKKRASVVECMKRLGKEYPELEEEDKHRKHSYLLTEKEAELEIKRIKEMPDDEFPVIREKDDMSGIVFYSREKLIEEVRRNIWHGDD